MFPTRPTRGGPLALIHSEHQNPPPTSCCQHHGLRPTPTKQAITSATCLPCCQERVSAATSQSHRTNNPSPTVSPVSNWTPVRPVPLPSLLAVTYPATDARLQKAWDSPPPPVRPPLHAAHPPPCPPGAQFGRPPRNACDAPPRCPVRCACTVRIRKPHLGRDLGGVRSADGTSLVREGRTRRCMLPSLYIPGPVHVAAS